MKRRPAVSPTTAFALTLGLLVTSAQPDASASLPPAVDTPPASESAVALPSHAVLLKRSANASGARIRDITLREDPERDGLGAYAETWGDNLVFDRNGDRNPDVLLSFHIQPWEVWLGKDRTGFSFDRSLRPRDRHNCVVADFTGPDDVPDGREDLYCVRGANKGTSRDNPNELLMQLPQGGFVDVVNTWGARDPTGRGRAAAILDMHGDGTPSLFVGNAAPKLWPSRDHFFENVGERFAERSTGGLPSVQNTDCAATADFDHDGRQDLLTCSTALRLYQNRTRKTGPVSYREVAVREGIRGARNDAGFVDLNRDGWQDLVTVTNHGLTVQLNRRRSPHFPRTDFRLPLAAGFSFCAGRANRDRVPDLLVVQGLVRDTDKKQRRDWMLINSGSGRGFRPIPVPQPPSRQGRNGNGDTCSAIPHYQGSRAAWTINNGRPTYHPERHHVGYRQLVILTW